MNFFKKAWNWIISKEPAATYLTFKEYSNEFKGYHPLNFCLIHNFFEGFKNHTAPALMAIDAIETLFAERTFATFTEVAFEGGKETIVNFTIETDRTHGRSQAVGLKHAMQLSEQEGFTLIVSSDPKSKTPFKMINTYLENVRLVSIRADKSDVDESGNVKMFLTFNAVTSEELNKKVLPALLEKATRAAVSYKERKERT